MSSSSTSSAGSGGSSSISISFGTASNNTSSSASAAAVVASISIVGVGGGSGGNHQQHHLNNSSSGSGSGSRLTLQSMSKQQRRRSLNNRNGVSGNGGKMSLVSLLGICILVLLVASLCMQHLRNDDLFVDIFTSTTNTFPLWSFSSSEETEGSVVLAGDAAAAIAVAANDRKNVDELTALVIAEEDVEDLGDSRRRNNNQEAAQETDVFIWNKVQSGFEKEDAIAENKWWNRHGTIVHVIHTRVLQNQPRLVDFTEARFRQFLTFTLPSIKHQTYAHEFLWIVWTDPGLEPTTELWLKHAVAWNDDETEQENHQRNRMKNVVVIAHKTHRPSIASSWFQQTLDQSYILAGSYKLLLDYHRKATEQQPPQPPQPQPQQQQGHNNNNNKMIVLETYMDSEDALALNYVERIQLEAVAALKQQQQQPKAFRLWCPNQLMEWGYASPLWYRSRMEQEWKQQKEQKKLQQQQQRLQQQQQQQMKNKNAVVSVKSALKPLDQNGNDDENDDKPFIDRGFFTWKNAEKDHKCFSTSAGSTIGYYYDSSYSVQRQSQQKPLGQQDNENEENQQDNNKNNEEENEDEFTQMIHSFSKGSRAKWHEMVLLCDQMEESNCLGFLNGPTVLRSKTITAAAKRDIAPPPPNWIAVTATAARKRGTAAIAVDPDKAVDISQKQEEFVQIQQQQWNHGLRSTFGVVPKSIELFIRSFTNNLDKIVLDVLTICLPNNACKPSNKQTLQDLLTTVGLKMKKNTVSSWSSSASAVVNVAAADNAAQQQQQALPRLPQQQQQQEPQQEQEQPQQEQPQQEQPPPPQQQQQLLLQNQANKTEPANVNAK